MVRDGLQKDADFVNINNSVIRMQICFMSPNEHKHLSAYCDPRSPSSAKPSGVLCLAAPPVLTRGRPPSLGFLPGSKTKSFSVDEDAHPCVDAICQLPLGPQPGAGHALPPATPQQHFLLRSASLSQLLIILFFPSSPETPY